MIEEKRTIHVSINPLQFLEADRPQDTEILPEHVLRFFCDPDVSATTYEIVKRYQEINRESVRLLAAPVESRLLHKLVRPLRHAKASYIAGNYIGTISLCGMVAEMLSLLLYDISEFKINNKIMDERDQRSLFGARFEKLGQNRRIEVLSAYGIIDDDTKSTFDTIRTKRRRYLHLWSQDHEFLPSDAVEVYFSAVSLVVKVIGQDIREGKLFLNPALVKYLERQGTYEPAEPEAE